MRDEGLVMTNPRSTSPRTNSAASCLKKDDVMYSSDFSIFVEHIRIYISVCIYMVLST